MKPYPAYKDSGIEWIGEIPENWNVIKLKHVAKIVNGSTPKSSVTEYWDGDIEWVTPYDLGRLNGPLIESTSRKITREGLGSCGTTLCPKNSIIVSTRAPIGHIAINAMETCTNQGCRTIVPIFSKYDSKYMYYCLYSAKEELNSRGQGSTFIELSYQNLSDFKFPCLPIAEQQYVVNFLDHKTSQLDTLIEKKQKQIELLKEERTAIINQAVTKGLNPDIPMKDSGIEWLGEVPEHWIIKKLKFLSSIDTGEKDTVDREEDGIYPFFVRSQTVEYINSYSFDGEAVLTAGDGVGVGKVFHYYNGKFDYHQRVYKISNFKEIYGKYLFYYMQENFHKDVMKISAKSTVDSLRLPMFLDFLVAYADFEEQKQIVESIEDKLLFIDTLRNRIQNQITHLQEYRTALISNAVTGKIDVRDYYGNST